jgi:signal transduction histidine kinase
LFSVRHTLTLERAGLFLLGVVAALAGSRYPGAPLVMALPAGILFLSQRRALRLLAGEQHARAEAERAQAHVSLLANASAALAASLDYQTTLQSAVDLAIPALADSCSISIGRGDAASRWFSVAPGERVQQQRLDELLRHSPSAPWVDGGVRSELYPVVSDELFTRWALDPGCLQLFRELGPVSAMLVPLIARGQTLGGFALYATVSGRRYGSADLAVAEDIAQRIALAIDSAQLYEAERASRAAAEEAVARTSRLYEDQQRIVARLRELRGQLEAAERVRLLDDERERIARELHDRVEQTFFSIGLSVNALLASLPAWPMESLRSPLAVIRNSAQQGAEDLRAAIFALTRAEVHDLELVRALWRLVREFQKRTGLEGDLVESGAERRAPPQIAEVLHAVAREGLSNVERHARATAVVVSLCFEPDAVTLTVQDDGVGASALVLSTLADSATRFGLNGLNEQVLRLGGTFTAGPGDEEGFVLRVRLPLRDAAAP